MSSLCSPCSTLMRDVNLVMQCVLSMAPVQSKGGG
jgi:hypothetical protein